MTNAMIIFNEQLRLLREGKIGTTGRTLVYADEDGKHEMQEPEPIHTYAHWKSLGFIVKRGERAVAKFGIWKYRSKRTMTDDGQEINEDKMFLREASFFAYSQVSKA